MTDENNSTSFSNRGRQRLYGSTSEKVSAFRERNKEAGLLRKEVLVQADTSARLAELAKEQGTSVTNVASGLLEMGLAHFEALQSMGYVSTRGAVGQGSQAAAAAPAASGVVTLQGANQGTQPALADLAGALVGAASASALTLTSPPASPALASPFGLPTIEQSNALAEPAHTQGSGRGPQEELSLLNPTLFSVANPIAQFFDTRKNRLK